MLPRRAGPSYDTHLVRLGVLELDAIYPQWQRLRGIAEPAVADNRCVRLNELASGCDVRISFQATGIGSCQRGQTQQWEQPSPDIDGRGHPQKCIGPAVARGNSVLRYESANRDRVHIIKK